MIDDTLEFVKPLLYTFVNGFLMRTTFRQAYETRAEFGRQRSALSSMNTRMAGVMSKKCLFVRSPLQVLNDPRYDAEYQQSIGYD